MKIISKLTILTTLIFLVSSCADYKLKIAPEAEKWEEDRPDPNLKITHTMFMVGDAGNSTPESGPKPALKLLKNYLNEASKESSILFLGDNIYPSGMPPKREEKDRASAEFRLDAQIDVLENFKGRPIFMPGNHDWDKYGLDGIRRQEKYIEKHLAELLDDEETNFFLPDNGCSGPEIVEINDQLVVIVIDSNWWLMDWDQEPNINDDCDIKNREVFKFLFNDTVRKFRSKNCVIALHHPMYSNGTHGGKFTFKQHLFPLTEKSDNLWIPFPVIGSIAQLIRATTGTRQDLSNGNYKELINAVVTPAKKSGKYIFASGHEHSMQYFENDDQAFIISGAGSKETPTAMGNGALMTYGHYGFSKMDFYEDGSAWIEFVVPIGDGNEGRTVFRRKVKDKLEISPENIPTEFPNYKNGEETIITNAITTETEEVGGLHKVILGEHWRDIYRFDYEFPKLDLAEFEGGVTILKRGGGNQTNSLRMEDKDGRQFTMRALTKDATRFIPYPFNQLSAANFLVKDNFLSTHPFAPLVIPDMADASNIYHTNPSFYYIPKQPTLGVHNDVFGDEVYLVEERPSKEWENQKTFGNPDDIISTYDVAEKIKKGYKHRVDQEWTVRTRLFDMLIGDWDRHDDQWRWSKIKTEGGQNLYRPIPRDRDQPFSKYDGAATALARFYAPFLRQLVVYKPELGNMKWAAWSPRHFDAAFMNELTLEQWLEQAKYIQENVTDEIIEKAFNKMPAKSHELSSEELISVLKQRRANLQDFAKDLYLHLAERVTIIGSEKGDYIEVIRQDKNHTVVRIFDKKKDDTKDADEMMYERVFNRSETEEVYIYGLNGDDVFHVEGDVKKGIKVALIGGLDEDTFTDISHVAGAGKKTIVYDNLEGNTVNGGKETKDESSQQAEENTYVRRGPQYEKNIVVPAPIIAFNPDDGFVAGLGLSFTNFAFGKEPFSQKHFAGLDYSFATNGLNGVYNGEFFDVLGRWDFVGNAQLTTSRSAINYFGLGNQTDYEEESKDDLDFHRVRQSKYYIDAGLQKRFAGNLGSFSIRPLIDIVKLEETDGRFITTEESGLVPEDFERQYYGGVLAALDYENVDNEGNPAKGMRFHLKYTIQTDLEQAENGFNRLDASWALYFPLTPKKNFVLATQVGFNMIDGEYNFYQAPAIGGVKNLRAFRQHRFRGERTFFHTTDLRLKLFSSKNSILPFTFGLHAGFDYGRAWFDDDVELPQFADNLQYGGGGGIWIAPIDFIVLNFGLYQSDENQLFLFRLGQFF